MSPNFALHNTFRPWNNKTTVPMCYYIKVKDDKSLLIEAYCTFRDFMYYAIGQTIIEVEKLLADKIKECYNENDDYYFSLTILIQVNDNLVKFRKELEKSSKGAKSLIYKL